MAQSVYVGVDGCPGGWFSVGLDVEGNLARCGVYDTFEELLTANQDARLVLVDIPIGLPHCKDERECDKLARKMLGPRRSSVFRTPTRQAVQAVVKSNSYEVASRVQREVTKKGLSKQTFNITHKIAQVDTVLHLRGAGARPPVREVHPEVCFWALNGWKAMCANKKVKKSGESPRGEEERLGVLGQRFGQVREIYNGLADSYARNLVAKDDILDALAAAVTGWLAGIGKGKLATLPENPCMDAHGLPMEMVYCVPR